MDESESPSWKGHSFTLLVFGGIVVLCSIFFVLGMLVGRSQGQRIAEMAAADEAARKPAPEALVESQPLDFFRQTTNETPDDTLHPRPAPPATARGSVVAPDPPVQPEPIKEPAAARIYLQIFATKDRKAADQEQTKVQSKGFRALILPPKPGDKDQLYRVQVGPYDTKAEAAVATKDLQSQGYKDVLQK